MPCLVFSSILYMELMFKLIRDIKFYFRVILREKCSYSKLLWSAFSRNQTEYGEILHISSYSVRMQKSADRKKFE